VKKLFAVTLGVLSAIGGFVDIGDIGANSASGARFGMKLGVRAHAHSTTSSSVSTSSPYTGARSDRSVQATFRAS
jgi:hypothetical protein